MAGGDKPLDDRHGVVPFKSGVLEPDQLLNSGFRYGAGILLGMDQNHRADIAEDTQNINGGLIFIRISGWIAHLIRTHGT